MAGTKNDVTVAKNADYSQANGPNASSSESNGLITNGQLWIGATSTNAGGTHINVGRITSPLGTLTIGYSSPNITIDLVGGAVAIEKFAMQTGTSPVVPTGGIVTFNGSRVAAGTNPVRTNGTGANTMQLEVQISQAIAATDATKIGLSNYNSAHFSVDANGFVSSLGAGFPWSDVSGAVNAAVNNGYFVIGTCTSTLPSSPSQGDTIKYIVDHASQLLTIQASAGKVIRLGNTATAAAGTAVSTLQGDAIELIYRSSDTAWIALSSVGQWNLT
jgi:hypothetical protein